MHHSNRYYTVEGMEMSDVVVEKGQDWMIFIGSSLQAKSVISEDRPGLSEIIRTFWTARSRTAPS